MLCKSKNAFYASVHRYTQYAEHRCVGYYHVEGLKVTFPYMIYHLVLLLFEPFPVLLFLNSLHNFPASLYFTSVHCKKGYRISRPPWMSITWRRTIKLFLVSESLVIDIPAGDGKFPNLFLQCKFWISFPLALRPPPRNFPLLSQDIGRRQPNFVMSS